MKHEIKLSLVLLIFYIFITDAGGTEILRGEKSGWIDKKKKQKGHVTISLESSGVLNISGEYENGAILDGDHFYSRVVLRSGSTEAVVEQNCVAVNPRIHLFSSSKRKFSERYEGLEPEFSSKVTSMEISMHAGGRCNSGDTAFTHVYNWLFDLNCEDENGKAVICENPSTINTFNLPNEVMTHYDGWRIYCGSIDDGSPSGHCDKIIQGKSCNSVARDWNAIKNVDQCKYCSTDVVDNTKVSTGIEKLDFMLTGKTYCDLR